MLSALGKLWMAGVQVDWSGFYQQEKRRRIALPTYPFERKRHWVEPRRSAETAEKPASPAVAELKVAMEDSAMYDATTDDAGAEERPTPRVAQAPKPRKEKLLAALTEQFQMLYGAQAQNLPVSARFTELGLDSLMLTQASQVLQSKFGIQIAFRRLVDDLGTFADLADFLDQKLPSDFFPPEPVASLPPASTPAEGPAGTGEPSLKAIQSQLRALETQLEVLRRAAAAVAPSQDAPASAGNAAAVPSNGASREPEPRPAQPVASIGGAGTAAVDDLPLTESQMELWLACQADQDASRAFNQVFAIHLPSRVNKEGLRAILQELVNRHDALRTTFASDGSSQRIWPSREIDFQFRDVSAFGEAERELEFSKAMENEDQTPFDLVNGPLFRARLLKSTQDRYVLILAAHHIILDGWSISVLLREFSQLYNARGGGSTAGLQPAMQYRDYVRWQRSAEHGAAVEAAEAYWLDRFSTLPNDLDLPTGRPRPHVKTYRAAEKRVLLDASVYSALKQAAAAHDCTLFVFLLAGLYAWLYRLAGEDDLVIGVPVAGQLAAACHPGNTSLVGHCVNSLPIRCQCDGNAPFADHLKNTKNAVLDAHEHQSMTLRTLVRKLQLRVDPSRAPLVQVMFNLGRAARQLRVPDAHLAVPRKVFNFFDLNIEGVDSGENLQFVFRYNSDLFDDAQLARMLNQFKTLLAAAAAEPHRKVMELPLLTDAERRQILIEWNRNAAADSKSRNLHQLIEAQVERTPEGLAVVFGDQQLTYRQLEVRANQLARYLQGLGVGPDCLVGLCMKRSLEMVVGVLAILKAGGAYVPLDPELPTERLALMMEDAHAPIVLTQEDLLEKVPASNARVICLDRDRGLFEVESAETPSSGATPDNLAYVIYTSGSTGKPKGVAMIRKAVENLIGWQCESPIFSAGLRTLQFASLGFDVSFQEIFSTWSSGGTLILVPEELRRDFGGLLGFLRNQRVERLFLPFVALECLAEIANEQQLLPSSLREIITAGEQLKVTPDIGKFFEKLDGCTLQNQYGPTESHVVTAFTLTGPPGEWPTLPPIGRPISNTSVFVLDDAKQPVPIGVRGELHIGGVCLARGYLNQPKLTAERFICAPVVSEAAVRLYRTGDLARFLPDGDIEFLGRSDFQVKIRGFRIEPGEIEAVLNQNPAVQASLVVAREDAPGDKRLVAYLTRRNGAVNPSELREYLSAKLPEYMVPAAFVTLEAFPLTPNGKVDRKALPKPDFELAADNGKFVPPSTPTEIALAKIWSEVLGVKQIGQHDDFFALGGHSLQATRIVSRIHSVLHADLALRSLLENPTLESLANAIDRHFVDEMQQDELNQLLLEVESMPDEQTH
jgi:amino acid adenylation domain-containing protein